MSDTKTKLYINRGGINYAVELCSDRFKIVSLSEKNDGRETKREKGERGGEWVAFFVRLGCVKGRKTILYNACK